jgi:acyl carrier protein
MSLPQKVLEYLSENAERAGLAELTAEADLFGAGVLDSFAIAEFIAVLEAETGIKVSNADVFAANFETIAAIERLVERRRG